MAKSLDISPVILALFLTSEIAGSSPSEDRPSVEAERDSRARVAQYLAWVDAYQGGDFSGPTQGLASWPSPELTDNLAAVLTLGEERLPAERTGSGRQVGAALLHTEVGLYHLAREELAKARPHFEMARNLIGRFTEAPCPDFEARWRLAVGCRCREFFYLPETLEFVVGVGEGGQPHAQALVVQGSVYELRSTYRNPVCSSRNDCPDRSSRSSYDRLEKERDADPTVREARLRLARVLARSGQLQAAQQQLHAVLDRPAAAESTYLAHLFLGQTYEDAQDVPAAVSEYRLAVEALPQAQAGRVALAHALRRLGSRSGERETLDGLIGEHRLVPDPRDPWWVYKVSPAVCRGSLWRDLRRDALQ